MYAMLLEIIYIWNILMFGVLGVHALLNYRAENIRTEYMSSMGSIVLIGVGLPLLAIAIEVIGTESEKELPLEIFNYVLAAAFAYLSASQFRMLNKNFYNIFLGLVTLGVAIPAIQLLPFTQTYLRFALYALLYVLFAGALFFLFKKGSDRPSI